MGRAGLSVAVGMIPGVGDLVDIVGAAVGRDLVAGEDLNGAQRWAMAAGTIIGSGRAARQAADVTAAAVLRRNFDNVVRPAFWKHEAASNAGGYSAANLERMRKGKPAIGDDGFSMELHHRTPLANGGTNDFDNIQPMTRSGHRLGENYKKNHPNLPEEE